MGNAGGATVESLVKVQKIEALLAVEGQGVNLRNWKGKWDGLVSEERCGLERVDEGGAWMVLQLAMS